MVPVSLLLLLVLSLLWPTFVHAQATCTHWISQGGSGSGSCPVGTPCNIARFWQLAAPGHVACLNNGAYTDRIEPPTGVAGTAGNPITIRAVNEGQVEINAQGNFGIWMSSVRGNNWFVVEGLNAKNGGEALYRSSGSDNIFRRNIGWDGTSGQADSNIFAVTGLRNVVEDCAGWGINSRKIFDGAQAGNVQGTRWARNWGEWNDHPQGVSQPNNTFLISYNTGNSRWYNNLGTWRELGQLGNAESIMEIARNCDEPNFAAEGTLVKGFFAYLTPGFPYSPSALVKGFCASGFALTDVLAYVPSGFSSKKPFEFSRGSAGQPSGSTCTNCLGVHNGTPSSNNGDSGWTLPGFREGNSLAAATAGVNIFTALPGLCYRYDANGNLTATGLWPWPMNQRILDARAASGYAAVNVTTTVEGLLGTIPAACRTDAGSDTIPPTVALTAPAQSATVSGVTVPVAATADDNVGVVGVQFKVGAANLGAEDLTVPYGVDWNTTLVGNGSHSLTAVARDAAGNTTTSASHTVTVANGGDVTPPTVALTFPTSGAVISGISLILTATASDNVGVAGVQFKIDGANLSGEDFTAPYAFDFNSALFADGSHSLTATARDTSGNLTTSTAVPITIANSSVDTTPPTVALTAPSPGATVGGAAVAVTATASDNLGVAGVQFKLDGATLGAEDTSAPYGLAWNSTLVAEGTHSLTATARDAAGNTTTSASVSVTVSNSAAPGAFYVSPTGNDANTGTSPVTAWATLQHAHDAAASGSTIIVLAGQYFQRVTITKNMLTWTGQSGTIIDGSDALTGWASQGSGVYRVAVPGYTPGALTALAQRLSIPKYSNNMMAGLNIDDECGTGLTVLAFPTGQVCQGRVYWDGWEAAFGVTGGFVYLRFRGGENPNTMTMRSAPQGGVFHIDGGDNNIIENMEIGGGTQAIVLTNSANDNIIRNNVLRNGYQQVMVQGGSGNQILNNAIQTRLIGSTAGYAANPVMGGNWSVGAVDGDAKLNIYHHDKFEVDDSGSEKTGGILLQGANSVIIDGNDIQGGTVGINLESGGTGSIIRNNYIAHHSAEGLYYSEYAQLEIAHNRFYDGSHLIRIQRMEFSGKTGWIYRNHFHQDNNGAKHIHFSFIQRAVSTNTLYIYHNTFTGKGWAGDLGGGDGGTSTTEMPNVRFVNNVLTGTQMDLSSVGLNGNPGTNNYLGMWAYNHCSGGCSGQVGGSSGNNINNASGGTNPMWASPLTEVLLPPAGHAALNSALRLDQTWTINGVARAALPGMAGGYYPDSTPHRGAFQIDETTVTDATPPTVALTAPAHLSTVSGGAVSVTATASDNVGVIWVQFQVDGGNLGAQDPFAPYAVTWDTTLVADGDYVLTAIARDAATNSTTSASRTVTVANTGGGGLITFLNDPTGLSTTTTGPITFLNEPTGLSTSP